MLSVACWVISASSREPPAAFSMRSQRVLRMSLSRGGWFVLSWFIGTSFSGLRSNVAGTASDQRVAGIVLSQPTGLPLPGAVVKLTSGQSSPLTVHASADGRFDFGQIPSGEYALTASTPSYPEMEYGALNAALPGNRLRVMADCCRQLQVRLSPGAVITGRIRHSSGEPAAGRRVTLARRLERDGITPGVPFRASSQMSDDHGVYRFFGLPPGEYVLAVTVNQSQDSNSLATVFYPNNDRQADAIAIKTVGSEVIENIDINLKSPATGGVRGSFSDGERSSRTITVSINPGDLTGSVVQADSRGRFSFVNVPPGQYLIRAYSPEIPARWAETRVFVGSEHVDVGDTSLQPTLQLAGTLSLESVRSERPALSPSNLSVTLEAGEWAPHRPAVSIQTGGNFTARGLVPGARYRLAPQVPGIEAELPIFTLVVSPESAAEVHSDSFMLSPNYAGPPATLIVTGAIQGFGGLIRDVDGNIDLQHHVFVFRADGTIGPFQQQLVKPRTDGFYQVAVAPGAYKVALLRTVDPSMLRDPRVRRDLVAMAIDQSVQYGLVGRLDLQIGR
jgi:hypothetical protein